jgi:23S rRNA (adenine2503-C2)-methyltransferase
LSTPLNIRTLSFEALAEWLKQQGQAGYRTAQIWDWLWKKHVNAFDDMLTIPGALRNLLKEHFLMQSISEEHLSESKDGTIKAAYKTLSGQLVEAVLIPAEGGRTTVCVSTQAGCALACSFCATGKAGFHGNLLWNEIYEQVYFMNQLSINKYLHPLNNIVYMGMGEPFLNFDEVKKSLLMLSDPVRGDGMSPSRITVSTAGIPAGIRRFAEELSGFQLALSLHSADQQAREKIMPVARKYSLEEITEALRYYHQLTKSRIVIEYILLQGINDTDKDMYQLATFCKSFPVKINLIPYNKTEGIEFSSTIKEKTYTFIQFLKARNLVVHARRSRGTDIEAACGQLAKRKTST